MVSNIVFVAACYSYSPIWSVAATYHVHVHLCFLLLSPVFMEGMNRGGAFKGLEQ